MSETNHKNAGAEAPLKSGSTRRFPTWSIISLEAYTVPLADGTYIYANVYNNPDPRDPHLYYAEIIREISTGSGPDFEHLVGESFDDLIEALLYLESVDLGDYETTDE